MTGVVGVDIQRTRTAVVLRESAGAASQLASIGDGWRSFVPNAVDETGRWGTPAAAAAGDEQWLREPWSVEFLNGLRDRLFDYLGRVSPTPANGYRLWFTASSQPPDLASLCAAAGLSTVDMVSETDALVSRWLASRPQLDGRTTVMALVCGESYTSCHAYRIDDEHGFFRMDDAYQRRPVGISAWHDEFSGEVLSHCRHGVGPRDQLGLFDGLLEFASLLRAHADAGRVDWSGPLAERMYAPLRRTARGLRSSENVRSLAAVVGELVASAAADLVLVGGLGAVWPFVAEAAGESVWQSRQPALDLAAGAACWPSVQHLFGGAARDRPPALEAAPAPAAVAEIGAVPDIPADQPPWLRSR